ncbi:MAG: ECF transporter S component [Candidatus Bathyarchaeota archaeon]|nr:MAG: ECF transporter S component [Candidatus Bathyarchaeota archaeon]
MQQQNQGLTSKLVAFIAVMSAVANFLGFLTIPIGIAEIHMMQLPIILTGLALGSIAGGLVGFIGATAMAFNLRPSNPYILVGNAILGFMTGAFYSRLKSTRGRPIIPQVISVLGAYIVQFPYVYVTDIYLMSMPPTLVLTVILPKLLLENIISVLFVHFILFRVELEEILR